MEKKVTSNSATDLVKIQYQTIFPLVVDKQRQRNNNYRKWMLLQLKQVLF